VLVWRVAHGGSPFWLVVVALQIQLMWSGIKLYREFAGAGAVAPP